MCWSALKTCCLKYLAIHKLLSTNIKRNSSVFGLVFPPFWISSSLTCFSQHEILSRPRRVALILDTWPDPRESIVQSSQWTTQILQCCPSSCRSLCPSVTQLVLIPFNATLSAMTEDRQPRKLPYAVSRDLIEKPAVHPTFQRLLVTSCILL